MKYRVFVDSDVVISSLLSKKGASHLLLYKTVRNVPSISSKSRET